jgi:purine-nucleoside phosphorylase
MSIHIEAKQGEISEKVLVAGDPLRAKAIAEKYLTSPRLYNRVRGMLGYTGSYKGKEVSIQGTGMGIPSISIYVHELIHDYRVKHLIRVGTCGTMQSSIQIKDIVIAQGASSDSAINHYRFEGMHYAPLADFGLLEAAVARAREMGISFHVGNVLSSDQFYHTDASHWKVWANYGVLAIEMEASALYTLAAQSGCKALTLLTVSDHLISGEFSSSHERQESFMEMAEIALEVI